MPPNFLNVNLLSVFDRQITPPMERLDFFKIDWKDQKEQWSREEWRQRGHDTGSIEADPLPSSPERDDYRLAADSPASQIGFVPLPFDLMGLIQDEYRKVWPIAEAPGAREKPLVKAHGDGIIGAEIL